MIKFIDSSSIIGNVSPRGESASLEMRGIQINLDEINKRILDKLGLDDRFVFEKLRPDITNIVVSSSSDNLAKIGALVYLTAYVNIGKGDEIKILITIALEEFFQIMSW